MAGAFEHHRFAGQHDALGFAAPHAQRANSKGVAKGQNAVPRNQGDHRIRTPNTLVHLPHCRKHAFNGEGFTAGGFFELISQHIDKHLRVALGVDVAVVVVKELVF